MQQNNHNQRATRGNIRGAVQAGLKPLPYRQTTAKEQQVSQHDNDPTANYVTGETTSAFRAELLGEPDGSAAAAAEAAVWGVEGLPNGSTLLVVKRGPNAGSRFRLNQGVTSAGRHPGSDIFLDDVTVSRHHAEFRLQHGEVWVVDVGSLNGTYVNREPVDSAVLANGDEIQIGKFRLVFLTRPGQADTNRPDLTRRAAD